MKNPSETETSAGKTTDSDTTKLPAVLPVVAQPPALTQESGKLVAQKPGKLTQESSKLVVQKPGKLTQDSGQLIVQKPRTAALQKSGKLTVLSKREEAAVRQFQEQCRQLNISTFFQENASARSLGFTSAIKGEGKTLLSTITADLLANDSIVPVTLIDCNWDHPSLHEYYNIPAQPGIAEWLRRECKAGDIRHQVAPNLTVIPAGKGRKDALRLLAQMRQLGLEQMFVSDDDLLVVDLPPIVTTAYGQVAASLLDTVVLVVHTGVTPENLVEEACSKLKSVPVQGIILNQFQSHIPRWLRQIL